MPLGSQLEGPRCLLLGPGLMHTLTQKLSYFFPTVLPELQKGTDITEQPTHFTDGKLRPQMVCVFQ